MQDDYKTLVTTQETQAFVTYYFGLSSDHLSESAEYPRDYKHLVVVLLTHKRLNRGEFDSIIPAASGSLGWPPNVALEIAIHPGFWIILLIADHRTSYKGARIMRKEKLPPPANEKEAVTGDSSSAITGLTLRRFWSLFNGKPVGFSYF